MKLSESIRLGSTLGPQITNSFTDEDMGSCAIGAAFLAIGQRDAIETYEGVDWLPTAARWFPSLAIVVCPEAWNSLPPRSGAYKYTYSAETVGDLMVELNDRQEHSREDIAAMIVENGWDCEAVFEHAAPEEVCA